MCTRHMHMDDAAAAAHAASGHAAAVAAAAAAPAAAAAADRVYSMHALTLPLPASLCARIQARLDARTAATAAATATAGTTTVAAAQPSSAAAAAPSSFALRCDWRIHVQANAPATAAAATPSTSALPSVASAGVPSSPLCLATLARSLAFITNAFPFAGAQETLDGLARVVALMPSFSAASRAPAGPMPLVRSASVRGQLLRLPNGSSPAGAPDAAAFRGAPVVLEASAERQANECAMLGQDTMNSWGDVDILLEEPPPSAGGSTAAGSAAAAAAASTQASAATSADAAAAPSAGLYCLNILPGAHIPLHVHRGLVESEFMLSGSCGPDASAGAPGATEPAALLCQGEAVRVGDVHRWEQEQAHLYENRSTTHVQRILCVNVPRFERSLEIEVERAPGAALCRPPRDDTESLALWRGVMAAGSSFSFPGGLPSQRVTLRTDPATFVRPHAVLVFVFDADDAGDGDTPLAAAAGTVLRNPALLFVRHRVRGWELPGGKVEPDESALAAAVREVAEESCVRLCTGDADGGAAPRLLAQYDIEEEGFGTHVKSVFVARAQRRSRHGASAAAGVAGAEQELVPQQETDAARFVRPPPEWTRMFANTANMATAASAAAGAAAAEPPSLSASAASTSSGAMSFSSILNDNVYPICLQLALASLHTTSNGASNDVAPPAPAC